jgi:hypothetical protein
VPLHQKEGRYRIPAVKSATEEHRGKPANAPQNINRISETRLSPPSRANHFRGAKNALLKAKETNQFPYCTKAVGAELREATIETVIDA